MAAPEQFTFHQVEEQLGSSYAAVLVPRTNGDVSTGRFEGEYDRNGYAAVHFLDRDGTPLGKLVDPELLSDQYQEKLAVDLGGMALRSQYDVLLTGSDEDIAKVQKEVMARQPKPIEDPIDELRRLQIAADSKYDLAIQSGATPEQAEASANRVYDNTKYAK